MLQLPGVTVQDEEAGVKAFLKWLNATPGTLLILDNADDIGHWKDLLPPRGKAHVLLTARPDMFKPVIQTVRVETMDEDTGADCLLEWASVDAAAEKQEEIDARALSVELGGLPLALRQAGSYCAANGSSLGEYRKLFADQKHNRQKVLLDTHAHGMSADEKTVYQTFSIALDKLKEDHAVASWLMALLAFVAPDAIPQELFTENYKDFPDSNFAAILADPLHWSKLRGVLLQHALITVDPKLKTLAIHRLLQEVIRQTMMESEQIALTEAMLAIIGYAFPIPAFENWEICERLTPHALAILQHARQQNHRSGWTARIADRIARYMVEMGQYADALPLFKEVLATYCALIPVEQVAVAGSLNHLGHLYNTLGEYDEALPLLEEALEISRASHPEQHQLIVAIISNLGAVYVGKGSYDKALLLFEESLQIAQTNLSPKHWSISVNMNNIAMIFERQGKHENALYYYSEVLKARRETRPIQHPDIATSANNLATSYGEQGDWDKALPLCIEAAAIALAGLGRDHPKTQLYIGNALTAVCTRAFQDCGLTKEAVKALSEEEAQAITAKPVASMWSSINEFKGKFQQ